MLRKDDKKKKNERSERLMLYKDDFQRIRGENKWFQRNSGVNLQIIRNLGVNLQF